MKITIVADIYGENNNGTTITAKRLVENMINRGHEVTVVSAYKGEGNGYIVLPVRKFPAFNKYITKTNGVTFAQPDEKILEAAIKNSDVVHFLLPFKCSKMGLKIARKNKIPYTAAFHCQPENITSHVFMQKRNLPNKMIYKYFYKKFYRDVQFVHCPSKFIADQLTKNGYPMDKRIISNGVIEAFAKKESVRPPELDGKFLILFTGRYVNEKRQDLLVKAMKYSRYADKIQLIFAGNGPNLNKLRKMSRKFVNPPLFKLFPKEELCDTINYCDLYVHPSDMEIEGISCIEAFTCGLVPVISDSQKSATNQFALDDRCLFKRGDPKDLAQKIDYWIEHPEEKQAMSDRYLKYAEQYSIKNCMDEMEQMFYDAVEYYKDYYEKTESLS